MFSSSRCAERGTAGKLKGALVQGAVSHRDLPTVIPLARRAVQPHSAHTSTSSPGRREGVHELLATDGREICMSVAMPFENLSNGWRWPARWLAWWLAVVGLGGLSSRAAAQTVLSQTNFFTTPGLYTGYSVQGYQNVLLTRPTNCVVEAADLQGVNSIHLVSNDTAQIKNGYEVATWVTVSEPALRLTNGGARIALRFENLSPGLYFVRLVGRVSTPNLPRIRRPLYLHLRINDGLNGATNDYRMRVLYANVLEETGRFFFHALNVTNTLEAELFVGPGSEEALLLHRLEFYDALAGTTRQAYKTAPGTFTFAERAYERQQVAEIAAHAGNELAPDGRLYLDNTYWKWLNQNVPFFPTNVIGQARINRDDALWNTLPPLNVMHSGGDGGTDVGYYTPPPTNAGVWTLHPVPGVGQPLIKYYDHEFALTNATLQTNYTLADLAAHKPLPGAYPDDGLGVYVPGADGTYGSPGNYYLLIGPLAFSKMYEQAYEVISGEHANEAYVLPWRYHLTGDTNVAHDAALLLVRFALQWPAMQIESQDLLLNSADPELDHNAAWRWEGRRVGKLVYSGWSDAMATYLFTAYDRLFDYLQNNQDFADTVHRYVPWVQTPQDVTTLLDTWLLQAGIMDSRTLPQQRIRSSQPLLLGLILGASPVAAEQMDISRVETSLLPLGQKSLKNHYRNSFTQDGTMFIGSTFYIGESLVFLDAAASMARFKALGGAVPYDLTDLTAYPKIRALADFLLDSTVAGGYAITVGDAAGAIFSPRGHFPYVEQSAKKLWQRTADPRAAWLIQNLFGGRTSETDAEWAALTNAASPVRDPRLASASRVFAGFGLGILESGVESDDFRAKRAVVLRTGTGYGHDHADALDLNLFALGCRMANDFGQRNESALTTVPPDSASYTHNVVEVDGYRHHSNAADGWPGGSFNAADAWIEAFKTNAGAQFMAGSGKSLAHTNVEIFRRDVALVDVDATNSYVFDVFRVRGGKWHTWSFHGADSGVEPGGFVVNTPMSAPAADSGSAHYLRKHSTASLAEGVAPGKLEATWRLSRTTSTNALNNADDAALTVKTVAAEQSMLGGDFDAAAPRKFTKVSLFDRAGDVVMAGNLYSAAYSINQPIFYAQSRQDGTNYSALAEKEQVYPALIEPYAGQPFITASESLPIANNETDALKAVALQVTTASGHTDWLFSDGRSALREVAGGLFRARGRFGLFSQTSNVFRMLNLVGGVELTKGLMSVKPDAEYHRVTIQSVDYAGGRIYTSQPLPTGALAGQQAHIFNTDHHCSYQIIAVTNSVAGSALTFKNPADIGEFAVRSVASNVITSDDTLALDNVANRNTGLTAVNERGDKVWKIKKISDLNAVDNNRYRLTGDTVADTDFTDEDDDGNRSVVVYDFGAGDTLELPTAVSLRRDGGDYLLQTDVALNFTLPGAAPMEIRLPDGTWQEITVSADAATVSGRINVEHLSEHPRLLRVAAIPDAPPEIAIATADANAAETGRKTGAFTVTRTGPTNAALTVNFTVGGTAGNGGDFTALDASVTIPAGASSAPILVTPVDDEFHEGAESVLVTLAAGAGYTIGFPVNATVTITDNDPPPTVTITASDTSAAEPGADTGTFTVSRTGSTNFALTLNFTVRGTASNGVDYAAPGASVTIPPGASSAPILVTPVDDEFHEGAETVLVTLATGAAYTVGAPASATVTIADNDPPPTVTITASDENAAEPGADAGAFTVARTGPTNFALTLNFTVNGTATSGTDFSALGAVVTIPAGAASAPIPVNPLDDEFYEGVESVQATLVDGATYTVGVPASATVTIADNDPPPTVTITATDASAAEPGADTGAFTVTRTGPTNFALTVNFAVSGSASNGVDYSAPGTSATIPAGASSAPILVTPLDDEFYEGAETVQVTLVDGAGYTVGVSASATVTIADNDPPPTVTITATDASTAEPGADTGTFTVSRTGPTNFALPLNFTVNGTAISGADFAALGASATIPAGAASSPIIVTALDDALPEEVETVLLTLASGAGYSVGSPASATVTITDNDGGPPLAHWKFDEATGLAALDSAGPNPGALVNGPLRVAGKFNGGLSFDGVNDSVDVPDSNTLDLTTNLTISLWFKPARLLNAASGRKDVLKKFLSYWVLMNFPTADGKVAFVLNSGTPVVKSTTAAWQSNTWYHLAATYDGAQMKLYVNGALENTAAATAAPVVNAYPLQIGGNINQGFYFPGLMDDMRFYNRSLSAASVQALSVATPPPPPPLPNAPPNAPPAISDITNRVVFKNQFVDAAFTVSDAETPAGSLVVSGNSLNTTLVPNANLAFIGGGASRTVRVIPATNQTGVAAITVTVSDGTNSVSDTFTLTVQEPPPPPPPNTPPVIGVIASTNTVEDAPVVVPFTVGDAQTPAGSLGVVAASANAAVVPNASIIHGGNGSNRTMTITPAANQSGSAAISIIVTDAGGLSATNNVVLTVTAFNDPPGISDITNRVTLKNQSIDVPFTVADVEADPGSLAVTGSSANTNLVRNTSLVFSGSGASRTVRVTPVTNQIGAAAITITVSDGTNSASDGFNLTVQDTAPPPPVAGLISRWKFDEATGPSALDSAGANPGTLVNGPARTAGTLGGALLFNGTNNYVNVPDSNTLDVSNRFSISLWFKPAQLLGAATGRKALLQKFAAYWLIMGFPTSDGKLAFVLNTGGQLVKSTTASWNANQWYHAVATYDGASMKLYVNGVLQGTTATAVALTTNTSPLQIGGDAQLKFWFPGAVDDVRLYGVPLSAAEALALFQQLP